MDRESLLTRIRRRLSAPDYLEQLDELDKREVEPWKSTRAARQAVRDATGLDQIREWIVQQLLEPLFDTEQSRMAKLFLSKEKAELIADALLSTEGAGDSLSFSDQLKMFMVDLVPVPRQRHLLIFLGIGLATGALLTAGPRDADRTPAPQARELGGRPSYAAARRAISRRRPVATFQPYGPRMTAATPT